jgi:hypothetical protein
MSKSKRNRKRKRYRPKQKSTNRNTYIIGAIVVLLVGSISIPADFLEENKLVFFDLKLEEPTVELTYLGRVIPLEWYKEGQYLPGLLVSTPKGNVVAGIRVCEPCGSFSFHIVEKKYLQCDACGTRWAIEDFSKGEGGCEDFPPPMLEVEVGQNIEVIIARTGLQILT